MGLGTRISGLFSEVAAVLEISPREHRIKQYMKALRNYRQRSCHGDNILDIYNKFMADNPQRAENFLKPYAPPKRGCFSDNTVIPEEVIDRSSGIARLDTPALIDIIHSEMPNYSVDDIPTSNIYTRVTEIEDADSLDEATVASVAFVIEEMHVDRIIYSMTFGHFSGSFGTLQDSLQETEEFALKKVIEFSRDPDFELVLRAQLNKWKESGHYRALLESGN